MRKFTTKEKGLISNLIDNYPFYPSFQVSAYFSEQKIYSTKDLLEMAFLFWFLEENGYVYISQTLLNPTVPNDPNIKRALNGIFDINQKRKVESLLDGSVFVTDQLLELKRNDYKFIEEEQLDTTKSILNKAIDLAQEAKNQSDEARTQTTEAKIQTDEALKQTKWAFWTFIASLVTLIISVLISTAGRVNENYPKQTERSIPMLDTSERNLPRDEMPDSLQIIVTKDTLKEPLCNSSANEQEKD